MKRGDTTYNHRDLVGESEPVLVSLAVRSAMAFEFLLAIVTATTVLATPTGTTALVLFAFFDTILSFLIIYASWFLAPWQKFGRQMAWDSRHKLEISRGQL